MFGSKGESKKGETSLNITITPFPYQGDGVTGTLRGRGSAIAYRNLYDSILKEVNHFRIALTI